MNKRIRSLIDEIFSDMKMSAENLALRDELMANAQAHYDDAIANGSTEEQAFQEVASSLGDIRTLLSDMNGIDAETEETGESVHDNSGEDPFSSLGKAFGAIGDWSQQFVKQADDATGGMFSSFGEAAKKGVKEASKAAEEAFNRFTRSFDDKKAESTSEMNLSPEELLKRAKDIRAQAEVKQEADDQEGARQLRRKAYELEIKVQELLDAQLKKEQDSEETVEINMEETSSSEQNNTDDALDSEFDTQDNIIIHRFPANKIKEISVALDADDIEIIVGNENDVIISWQKNEAGSMQPDVITENGVLNIRTQNPDVFKTFFTAFQKNGVQVCIQVPSNYCGSYKIKTTSGNIQLMGIPASGIDISTTSGLVKLMVPENSPCKNVTIHSISGNINAEFTAEKSVISTVSGKINVSGKQSQLDLNTASGTILTDSSFHALTIDSVSGDCTVSCAVIPTGSIRIGTLSGDARIALPRAIPGFMVESSGIINSIKNDFGPNRYGSCALPIRFDSMSGNLLITQLDNE